MITDAQFPDLSQYWKDFRRYSGYLAVTLTEDQFCYSPQT